MEWKKKVYDYIQIVITVILPAVGGTYGVIAQTWGLPYTDQVVTTIAAVTACSSLILKGIDRYYSKNR